MWLTEYGQEICEFRDDARLRDPNIGDGKNLRRAMAHRRVLARQAVLLLHDARESTFDTALVDPNGVSRCSFHYVYRYNSNPQATDSVPPQCPTGPAPSAP
jgi:hypothetical protein